MKGMGLVPVENPSEWLIPADHQSPGIRFMYSLGV